MTDRLDPYRAVIAQARREAELIERGDWKRLVAAAAARDAVMAALPPQPPVDARPLLAEAERLVNQNALRIVSARDRTRAQLAALSQGRRALRGYAGGVRPGRSVDRRS